MKEYRYKINGTKYKIAVGDIRDNIVQVEVNGTPYKVELDTEVATRHESRSSDKGCRTGAAHGNRREGGINNGGRKFASGSSKESAARHSDGFHSECWRNCKSWRHRLRA